MMLSGPAGILFLTRSWPCDAGHPAAGDATAHADRAGAQARREDGRDAHQGAAAADSAPCTCAVYPPHHLWLCLLVLPWITTRSGSRHALHWVKPKCCKTAVYCGPGCLDNTYTGNVHTGQPTCWQVDVETDLPKVQQQLAAQAASPGGPESPSTPQTGVWNQHTGALRNPKNLLKCTSKLHTNTLHATVLRLTIQWPVGVCETLCSPLVDALLPLFRCGSA